MREQQALPYKRNPIIREHSRRRTPEVRTKVCKHGWAEPQELVPKPYTDSDGRLRFTQVWRVVEGQGCPQGS